MCFLRNGSSYSFETCTIGIGMPENLRVCWEFDPLNTKESDVLAQNVFSQKTDHHTALKCAPLQSACLKTQVCTEFDPPNTKESDVIAQNVFSQKWIIIQLWNCVPLQSACLKTSGCTDFALMFWPSKYKGKWCYSPKCVFFRNGSSYSFETVHHWDWHAWKPQGVLSLTLLNTKESDVIAQNVFSQKWIIIQLWNCVPLQSACLKTSGCTDFDPLNTKESDVIAQNVFSQK